MSFNQCSLVLYQISVIATHLTGAIFPAREARVARWYVYHKRRATLLAGKSARPLEQPASVRTQTSCSNTLRRSNYLRSSDVT